MLILAADLEHHSLTAVSEKQRAYGQVEVLEECCSAREVIQCSEVRHPRGIQNKEVVALTVQWRCRRLQSVCGRTAAASQGNRPVCGFAGVLVLRPLPYRRPHFVDTYCKDVLVPAVMSMSMVEVIEEIEEMGAVWWR